MDGSFKWCTTGGLLVTQLCPTLCDPVGFPGGSDGKESTCNAGDLDLIPGLGRLPGEFHGQETSGLQSMRWQRVGHD